MPYFASTSQEQRLGTQTAIDSISPGVGHNGISPNSGNNLVRSVHVVGQDSFTSGTEPLQNATLHERGKIPPVGF